MRAVFLLALLVTGASEAQRPRHRLRTFAPYIAAQAVTSTPEPDFEFLKEGSSDGLISLSTGASFCTQFAADITGAQSWCWGADGTNTGLTLSQAGTPTSVSTAFCPLGLGCAGTYTRYLFPTGGAHGFNSTNQGQLANDFAMGALLRVHQGANSNAIIGKGAAGTSYVIQRAAGNASIIDTGASTITTNPSPQIGGFAFTITNADQGASGDESGNLRVYTNDMYNSAGSTTLGGAQMSTTSSAWTVGHSGPTSNSQGSEVFLAFVTQKLLNAATRAAMRNWAYPLPKSTDLTKIVETTRASGKFCVSPDGTTYQVIDQDTACITGDGSGNAMFASPASSYDLTTDGDVIAWAAGGSTSGTITLTNNNVAGPHGFVTADKLAGTTAGAFYQRTLDYATTGTLGTYSTWIRGDAAQDYTIKIIAVSGGATMQTCSGTASATFQRVTCSATGLTNGATYAVRWYPGGEAGTGTIYVSGHIFNNDSIAGECHNWGGVSNCPADVHKTPSADFPLATGSVAVDYIPDVATHSGARLISCSNGTVGWELGVSTTSIDFYGEAADSDTSDALTWTPGTKYRVRADWTTSGATTTVTFYRDDVAIGTGTVDAPSALPTDVHMLDGTTDACVFGNKSDGSKPAQGRFGGICIADEVGGCA